MAETLLVLSGNGVAPYSARGLTETLAPIAATVVPVRTVNGDLINMAPPQMQKYALTLSCTDINPPALSGVWPGAMLTVWCVSELGFDTMTGAAERPIVPDSSRMEGDITYYRPALDMMVVGPWSQATDEYGASVAWTLPLEEV